jgi:hypothetical protein
MDCFAALAMTGYQLSRGNKRRLGALSFAGGLYRSFAGTVGLDLVALDAAVSPNDRRADCHS